MNKSVNTFNKDSDVNFPFTKISVPEISMAVEWTKAGLIEYVKTWSAYKLFKNNNNIDIFDNFLQDIIPLWSDDEIKLISMDFTFYCGKKYF